MGTDIHGVWQFKDAKTAKWHDIASNYKQDRHYQLFAVLAGVRNGFGFAGFKTGDDVSPIDEARGLPEDFLMDNYNHPLEKFELMPIWRQNCYNKGDKIDTWMGDHSHSWLGGEEMLAWYETAPKVTKIGILDRDTYKSWDRISEPENYCAHIEGRDVVLISCDEKENTDWTHIRCEWGSELREELAYFFEEVASLVSEHGEVRFVFGFDS